jgi:two-component system chemotaxis response regulator CheY
VLRILVIDDEPFVLEALKRVLAATAVVVVASTADAGLTAMRETPVDLVIIDVILPGMDGVAAIKVIRRDHPGVRIIAISGGGNFGLNSYLPDAISTSAYLAACRAAGADGVLAKPFETTELRSLIDQVQAA